MTNPAEPRHPILDTAMPVAVLDKEADKQIAAPQQKFAGTLQGELTETSRRKRCPWGEEARVTIEAYLGDTRLTN
jgi:hypothetical protein